MCDTLKSFQLLFVLNIVCHVIATHPLVQVSTEKFRETIDSNKYTLVLFYYDIATCPRCTDAEKEIEKVNTPEMFDEEIFKVKCEDPGVVTRYGITKVPQLMFFRGDNPVLYEIPETSHVILAEDVEVWLDTARDVATQTLTDESFEHLTQASTGATTGDWLVVFFNSACESYLPAVEGAAIQVKHRMNVAKVNTEGSPGLVSRFNIKECPTTYFFRLGKMYLYYSDEKDHYDVKSLKLFVTSWYKNVKAQKVPGIPTAFEKLTESIAKSLKDKMNGPNRNQFLITVAVIMGGVTFVVSLVVVLCAKRKDEKTE